MSFAQASKRILHAVQNPTAPHNKILDFSRPRTAPLKYFPGKTFHAIISRPMASGIQKIDLSWNLMGVSDATITALSTSPAAQSLVELDISHTYMTKRPVISFPKLEKLKHVFYHQKPDFRVRRILLSGYAAYPSQPSNRYPISTALLSRNLFVTIIICERVYGHQREPSQPVSRSFRSRSFLLPRATCS